MKGSSVEIERGGKEGKSGKKWHQEGRRLSKGHDKKEIEKGRGSLESPRGKKACGVRR